eukprot:1387605-Prymnesium_polylepis.1
MRRRGRRARSAVRASTCMTPPRRHAPAASPAQSRLACRNTRSQPPPSPPCAPPPPCTLAALRRSSSRRVAPAPAA